MVTIDQTWYENLAKVLKHAADGGITATLQKCSNKNYVLL